jgi:hypothetical protein
MITKPEMRKAWRGNWLSCLREFADAESQRRTWLDPNNRNLHYSYVEFMCSYFDDILRGDGYHWAIAEGLVTAEESSIVAPLHRLLEQHEAPGKNDYDNEAILNDPAWADITDTAKQVASQLAPVLTDQSERDVLLGKV